MEVLDGDDVRLTDSRGRVAERDIVQVIFWSLSTRLDVEEGDCIFLYCIRIMARLVLLIQNKKFLTAIIVFHIFLNLFMWF